MSLRDLLFDISFQGNVTDLVKMDSAVDDVKDNTLEATSNIAGMEKATDNLSSTTGKNSNFIVDHWKGITGGLVAIGGVAEKVTRDNAELNESTEKLAQSMGITGGDAKDMALELTNVTFPLEDVTALMETGRQQGIKSTKQLKEYATFWDTVGDATGLAGPELGKASVGLRAVGIAAGEEKEALNAFGYITENTSGNVSEFLTFLEKTGPELREMGVDIDDSAALLGILEQEFGMSGRTARQEFRKAVNESDGDLNTMLDTLGISSSTFEDYTSKVSDSSDVIERNADIHAESYTVTERLAQKVSEMGFKYGDAIGIVSDFAPMLMAIGPLAKGVSVAQGLLSKGVVTKMIPAFAGAISSTWAFTTALLANPITWVIAGVVALGAAIWAFSTDFGGVTTFVKEKFGEGADWVQEKFDGVVTWFSEKPAQFKDFGKNIVDGLISGITEKAAELKDIVTGLASNVGGWFKSKLGIASDSKVMIGAGLDTGGGLTTGLEKSIPKVRRATENITQVIQDNYSPILKRYSNVSNKYNNVSSNVSNEYNDISSSVLSENINNETSNKYNHFNTSYNNLSKNENSKYEEIKNDKKLNSDFKPIINIKINGNADEANIAELEDTVKDIFYKEQKKFWNNLKLQQA